jgi:hypothetical protein
LPCRRSILGRGQHAGVISVKQTPLVFTSESICAILSGKKTQTRRVLRWQPLDVLPMRTPGEWVTLNVRDDASPQNNKGGMIRCRFGVPGDQLWVRETWALVSPEQVGDARWYELRNNHPSRLHPDSNEMDGVAAVIYRTDWDDFDFGKGYQGWRSSLFMPRWASRITLEVTDVRVQRVQDIRDADAQAEGVPKLYRTPKWLPNEARSQFIDLWGEINGKKHPWAENPYVWAITFKRL